MAQQLNIFQVIQPIYYFETALGFIPFTIDFKNRKLERRTSDVIIGIIRFLLCSISLYLIIYEMTLKKDSEKILFETGLRVNLLFGALIGLIGPIFNIFQHKRLQEFFTGLHDFDQKVQKLGMKDSNRKQKLFTIILFITFQTFFALMNLLVLYIYDDWKIEVIGPRDIFSFLLLGMFFLGHNLMVIFSLYILKMRFEIINNTLR